VYGKKCQAVIACTDPQGRPLCDRCGFVAAMERREMVPAVTMQMVDVHGGRRAMSTSFSYLPPTAMVSEPRVMALIRRTPDQSGR
jgi:hypothetical protein